MTTRCPSVGTSGVNECPEPTGRNGPLVVERNSTSSPSDAGAKRPAGWATTPPDQLRQGSAGAGVSGVVPRAGRASPKSPARALPASHSRRLRPRAVMAPPLP